MRVEWRLIPPPCAWRLVCDCIRLIIVAVIAGNHHVAVWLESPSITCARDASKLVLACQRWHRLRMGSVSMLKCQCHGCSNCNKWRNAGTPGNVKWFRSTGNRCGGDIRKKNWHRIATAAGRRGRWSKRLDCLLFHLRRLTTKPSSILHLRRLATKPSSRSECCGPSWWRCKETWI